MLPVVEAADPEARGTFRRFLRCDGCGTYLLDPPLKADYGGDLWAGLSADRYFEAGVGIDFIARALSAVPVRQRAAARLVDVGCGCGFSVHYWRSFGREAQGVEPSSLAEVGAERLGIPILRAFAGAAPELEGRRFDVVLSTEVVEHVPDPSAFVRILASLRGETGLVLFTTPDAARLDDPGVSDLEAWEILSPGLHSCVLSESAVRRLVADAGLAEVVVERVGLRLVCAASSVPVQRTDPEEARRDYGEYLVRECGKGGQHPSLRDGLAFRRFQHLLGAGDLVGARAVVESLNANLRARLGFDAAEPGAALARVEELEAGDGAAIGEKIPWFLLELHCGLGFLAAASSARAAARGHFDFVSRAAPRLVALLPGLLPTAMSCALEARFQLATLLLDEESTEGLERFLDEGELPGPENAWVRAGRGLLAAAASELFHAHVEAGRWEAARREENRLVRLLSLGLGAPGLDARRVASWIDANPIAALERRNLFFAAARASFDRALLRLRGDREANEAVAAFSEAFRIVAAFGGLPGGAAYARGLRRRAWRQGPRAAYLAEAGRRRAGS